MLPGGLNVFLGAITILGLSTKQLVTLPLLLDATTDLFGEQLHWKGQLLVKAPDDLMSNSWNIDLGAVSGAAGYSG